MAQAERRPARRPRGRSRSLPRGDGGPDRLHARRRRRRWWWTTCRPRSASRPPQWMLDLGMRSTVSVPIGRARQAVRPCSPPPAAERVTSQRTTCTSSRAWPTRWPPAIDARAAPERWRCAQSEARFRELADSAPGVHLDRGRRRDGRLHQPRLARVHRPPDRGRARATPGTSGVHPDDAEGVRSTWWRAFRRRVPWEREYRLRRHDGVYRWIVDRGVPRFEGDELVGLRGHGHRHPRAQGDGGEAQPRRRRATTRWPRRSSARCCPRASRRSTACSWRRATCPPPRRRDRRRLVRRDRAGRRARGGRGGRRGGPRAAGRDRDGPAAQRVPGLRAGGDLARADARPAEPAAGQGRPRPDGHRPVHGDRPRHGRGVARQRGPPAAAGDRERGRARASSRAGARCRSARPTLCRSPTPTARLEPGATLVLYTDGLVERRDTSLDDRLAQLATVALGGRRRARRRVRPAARGHARGQAPGRRRGGAGHPARAAKPGRLLLRLPADPAALAQLRRRLGRFLEAAGAGDGGALRDHPHRVRGRGQRDRARLRARRRGVRAARPGATARRCRSRCATSAPGGAPAARIAGAA